ncbi:MAG: hypothetical protein ACKVVT_06675 [Dehalococcoidia bacterium]
MKKRLFIAVAVAALLLSGGLAQQHGPAPAAADGQKVPVSFPFPPDLPGLLGSTWS